ncbi:hypothetical protein CDD83_8233 [Cordyceps sp. RAO-2017]|nr:hypothetical protein CDD83_8233 [Cordyceps sp. RAO-2017]
MPKRKRSSDNGLQATLEKHQDDLFRALKAAKGFERQRLSKRLRDDALPADRKLRLEREVAVLKSLDLHQTARAHLTFSLLKVKSIAGSPDLPEPLRAGVPKPDLPDEERAALHNVTSGLYNRGPVKQAVDQAVAAVCRALSVPLPGKAKRPRKGKGTDDEEGFANPEPPQTSPQGPSSAKQGQESPNEESEFEGFESDVDEPGSVMGQPNSEEEADEETAFSKYDQLLGSSSEDEDDDDDDGLDEDVVKKLKGTEKVNLDDISVSGSSVDTDDEQDSASSSRSPSPPPATTRQVDGKKGTKAVKIASARDSTFLPSLIGGYVSGSESASEIEDAKPKKRRGQRARQAIWEKKFGASAKHLRKQSQKGGRDSGWDMRRGAVNGEEQGRRTPWKKGVRNPLATYANSPDQAGPVRRPEPKATKRDDEGSLHPSWAAKKKAQDAHKSVAFSGQKVVFE